MQQSRRLIKIWKFFNKKHSFKGVYYFFVSKLTSLKPQIIENDFEELSYRINSSEVLLPEFKVKEFNPTCVLVRNKDVKYEVEFKNANSLIAIDSPNYNYVEPITHQIKLNIFNLDIISVIRNYLIEINSYISEIKDLAVEVSINYIDKAEMALQRKVLVTDEIVEILPYIKKAKKDRLYEIPVFKKPLIKTEFSSSHLTKLRENLAEQNKLKVHNVEIVSIYDKLAIDYYKSMKPETKGKGIFCYLNKPKISDKSSKYYYLIIGKRRDNKTSIKALVLMDKI